MTSHAALVKAIDTASAHAYLDVAIFSWAHLAIRCTSLINTGFLPVEIQAHVLNNAKIRLKRVSFVSCNLFQSIIESRKLVDGDQNSDEDGDGVEVQPASFLEESYSASETITVTTIDQEQYTCVLPDLTGEAASRVSM